MNEQIRKLEKQSYIIFKDENSFDCLVFSKEKFAELIVQEIVNTLEFHGYEEAIPYIKWMAINKLGIGE